MNEIIEFFPNKIIKFLGGYEKFRNYPITDNSFNVYSPITVGVHQNCPLFILSIKYKDKIFVEVFKQKNVNNKEIWVCSCNSNIFSHKEYNIYFPDQNQQNELRNIDNLVQNRGIVQIYNFTSGYYDDELYINACAELI